MLTTAVPLANTVVVRCALGAVADYPDQPAEWGDLEAVAQLWSVNAIQEAVLLASPVLAREVEKLLAPSSTAAPLKKRKRLHKSLLKYALRLSTRCTPFGMFAGVAALPVGDGYPTLGDSHIRRVRASGAVTRRLLAETRALPQARLYPNPALTERADRLVVAVMRGADDTHTRASIRATGPAKLAVATAAGTATRHDIEQRVSAAYPAADDETVHNLVSDLLQAEVLLCEAEHSAFDGDPLARVPDALAGVDETRRAVARYAGASDAVGDGSLAALLQLCAAGEVQRSVHVDLDLDVSGQVPSSVVGAAHAAVAALTRAMAHPTPTPALDQFSAEFAKRYGRTLVPFLTAVDDELGIGYPRYAGQIPESSAGEDPTAERRRNLIARLLQQSMSDRSDIVELTDADLDLFPEPCGMPASFDVMLKLHQTSSGLQTSVLGLGMPGGSAIGRFTAVMPWARELAQQHVEFDVARWADDTSGRGILCGIDYIAGSDSINNVAATAQLYPVTLAVNARPQDPIGTVLTLADIYLGHADGRLRTVLADGTPVRVRQLNMAASHSSAKAVRLLQDISDAGTSRPAWSWGDAEAIMNHLPAVRYRGVTLTEQRWRYPTDAAHTRAALQDWIFAAGVSRHIVAGRRDNRLHLDTQNPAHLDLALEEIAAGNRWVRRAPAPVELGVVADRAAGMHAAEVVVTVAAPNSPHVEPDLTKYPRYDPADDDHRLLLPGSAWTAFSISAARNTQDRVLGDFAESFPDLTGEWYFVRYREHDRDQLRLRIRRPIAGLTGVLAWLADARVAGRVGDYSIPVYHRELERYGGRRSFPCYEQLFCRETEHIVAMLPIVDPNLVDPELVRPGVEAAAGILAQWLDSLDPGRVNADEVIDVAVKGYSHELGNRAHKIKTALRQRHSTVDSNSILAAALDEFWADPAQREAVLTPAVLQSASHLLCNRLGLQRHEEFAAMWLVKTERNRRAHTR